jgi:hypothetical protein
MEVYGGFNVEVDVCVLPEISDSTNRELMESFDDATRTLITTPSKRVFDQEPIRWRGFFKHQTLQERLAETEAINADRAMNMLLADTHIQGLVRDELLAQAWEAEFPG